MEVSTTSWHVKLACGKELHGSEIGTFANVKYREDIVDLWVETGAGKVHAIKRKDADDGRIYDFYVHIVAVDGVVKEKYFKLITIYPDRMFTKYVHADGRYNVEMRPNGNKK